MPGIIYCPKCNGPGAAAADSNKAPLADKTAFDSSAWLGCVGSNVPARGNGNGAGGAGVGGVRRFDAEGVTLFCADCREIIPKLSGVDSVITDPPYGVELKAKLAKKRDTKGDGSVRLGEYNHEDTPEYVKAVVVAAIGMCLVTAPSMAVTPGTRNLHLYPIPDDIGCFFSAAGTGRGSWGFTCMQPILYYGKDPYLARCMGARANSCGQTYPNDANEQAHPCAKPIAMMRWLVARASLEGMTVLDPFMGSGTTGVACIEGGRRFIGIEKDPAHFETAVRRITAALAQGVLFPVGGGGAERQGDMLTATEKQPNDPSSPTRETKL